MISNKNKRGARRGSGKRSAGRRDDLHVKSISLGKNVYGFPLKMVTKLRYCDTYQITSTSGSIAKQLINVNSIWDPDQSGSGHHPLYRDKFAAIYDQYAVISAKVRVTFVSNAATSAMLVGVVTDDDTTTSSTFQTLCEQSTSQHWLIPNATGALNNHTFYHNWSAMKHLGIDPYTSELYKTSQSANPTEVSTILLWATPADGTATTTTTVFVELEQTVLFTELSTPVQA